MPAFIAALQLSGPADADRLGKLRVVRPQLAGSKLPGQLRAARRAAIFCDCSAKLVSTTFFCCGVRVL